MSKKLLKPRFDVCVIGGAGHVGLPLGVSFALAGKRTVLLDINEVSVASIMRGKFPFKEEKGDEHLKKALKQGTLTAVTGPADVISQSKVIVMVVGTPVDEYLNPHFGALERTLEKYLPHFRDGQVFMLRSTVFPGTAERIQSYFKKHRLTIGVAFCPERIVQGKAFKELKEMPQIISAFDKKTLSSVRALFSSISNSGVVEVEPVEAELAKLYSNAWRYITFAVVNQFYMMANDLGVDYTNIHKAMTLNYERNKNLPRPGFTAGPCLFKDTMQLAAFNHNRFFLGHSAMLINEGLPQYIMQHVSDRVGRDELKKKTIGILGMAFKADSDDHRDSLSFKLRKVASQHAREVLCHDYFLERDILSPLDEVLKKSHILIVATPHSEYKMLPKSALKGKVVIDIWNHLPSYT
ncbi:MAG: nucleotide sugar dehydrogenase [Patescibacteria group bacterium]